MKTTITIALLFLSTFLFAQPSCQWAYIPVGTTQSYNTIYNSTTDHSGNIITLGILLGSADMDPGTNPADTSFTLYTYNYYVSKTDIAGNLLWIHYFQNNSQIALFDFVGVKVNSANEIIVVGNYAGLIDFDFSDAGVDTIRSHFPTYTDYFVAKYDSAGSYKWAISIGDPTTSDIVAHAVTVLSNDNIVIAANPNGTIDVDPDAGVHNSIGGNGNIICYDNNGEYVWNNNIATATSYCITNNSLESDLAGNVYVATVGYYKLTINKFDNVGNRMLEMTIGDFPAGARVNPQSVLMDKTSGDIYVSGTFEGMVDFDPGAGTVYELSSSSMYQDGFIAKYDQLLNLNWVQTFEGKVEFGKYGLDFCAGEIVAVGNISGTIDFGNGNILSSNTTSSVSPFFITINSTGVTQNGFTIEGYGRFNTVHTCSNNSFAMTGMITDNTDMDPTAATLILNATTTSSFTAVYQSTTTSIPEAKQTETIIASPNPANNYTNIIISPELIGSLYNIHDITGRIILTGKLIDENNLIHLDNLADGLYSLSIAGMKKQVLRIVKQ